MPDLIDRGSQLLANHTSSRYFSCDYGVTGIVETRFARTPSIAVSRKGRPMSVRSIVIAQFEQVAREQKKTLSSLSDDTVLLDCGLDSLCFAIIVARLEDALRTDPFAATEDVGFPVTVVEFIKLYEDAAR